MELKRLYKKNEEGELVVSGIRMLRSSDKHHFSPRLVEGGGMEGWLSLANGRITIHAEDGDHVYKIVRVPGRYCCHCQEKLDDSKSAIKHVLESHGTAKSPDPQNPAGYCYILYYDTVKES